MTTIEELARCCTDNYEWQEECLGHCEDEKCLKTDKIHNLRKIIFHPKKTKSICSQNLVLKCDDCDPKSNVRKSTAIHTATKTSKSTTSHTATKVATTADSPFILDQKHNDCDPNSNVRKSARWKLSMVESDIDILKIKLSASNTSTKTTKLTASHTATKTSKSTTSHTATKVAITADGPFNWKKMLDKLHKVRSYDKIVQLVHHNVLPQLN